ncbi:MAG TPA: YfiR family protein [Gammaproteobacteria bacterium]|nr:YfiR family protein [Gammaproteobacteria bacterium]
MPHSSLSLRTLISVLLCICAVTPAMADPEAVAAQQRIEAAYLYKFGGYVTWPDKSFAGADSPIVIGVAGADALAEDLSTLVAGRDISGRPVRVKRIQPDDPLGGIDILFVGTRADALFSAARGLPILVVTDGDDGLARGASVSFVLVDDRVRFDVALDAAQQNGLKLSALLLSVAHNVSGAKP